MLGISYYFSRKYFGEKFALLFSILLAFSPINMAMARRALVDMPANLFLAASLWLFFDMLEQRKKFKCAAFTAIYTIAILMKESAVLLATAFVFYLLIRKYVLKKDTSHNDFLCAAVYPSVITAIIYLIVAGSPATILKTARIIITSPSTNQYAIVYCSGSWLRYIADFFLISPWVLLLAVGFIISYFSVKKRDDKILYFMAVTLAYYLILNLFAKNLRYAMLLDIPIRLFAASAVLWFSRTRSGRYDYLYALLVIIAIAAYDYALFYKFFIVNGIYDPVTALLLKARAIF
jgi:4-amino-4-deoxy-L-arabinose transferase-like glycosyltransferase